MSAQVSTRAKLPIDPDVCLMVFEHMDSLQDIKTAITTCKAAHEVFESNSNHIAKTQICRILDTTWQYKLAVMAVASRDVDPTNRESIQGFFQKYMRQADPWPVSCFTMDIAAALPRLEEAAKEVCRETMCALRRRCPMKSNLLDPSRSETLRVFQAAFMLETAANLFHRMPGVDGEILIHAPHGDLKEAYWSSFSRGEWDQVNGMVNQFRLSLVHGFMEWSRGHCDYGHLCDWIGSEFLVCECEQHLGAAMFSCMVGMEQMSEWSKWNSRHVGEDHPIAQRMQEFLDKIPRDASGQYIDENKVNFTKALYQNRPQFQPDPDVLDRRTRMRLAREGAPKFFNCRNAHIYPDTLPFSHKDTLEKFGAQWRLRFPEYVGYVSDEEDDNEEDGMDLLW